MRTIRNSRRERYAQAIAAGHTTPEAYRLAGYSTRGKGWHRNAYSLRETPDIAARVRELIENRVSIERRAIDRATERLALSKEGLARELLPTVMVNIADYLTIDEHGHPYLDLSRCTRAQLSAIKSIQIEEGSDGGGEARRMRCCKIQLRDPVPAAMAIARLFGLIMAPPRPESPTPLEQRLRAMTPEQRREDARQLYERIQARLRELPDTVEAVEQPEDGKEAPDDIAGSAAGRIVPTKRHRRG